MAIFLTFMLITTMKEREKTKKRKRETREPRLFFGLPFKFDNKEWTWIRHFLSLLKGKHFRPFSCLLFVKKVFQLSLSPSLSLWYSIFLVSLLCPLLLPSVLPFLTFSFYSCLRKERETMVANEHDRSYVQVKEEEADSRESSSAFKRQNVSPTDIAIVTVFFEED